MFHHHVINYHPISNAFETITGIALQEYKECNNLPRGISGPLNVIIKVSNTEYFQLHTFAVHCIFSTLVMRT
jgi:hypothetical protein